MFSSYSNQAHVALIDYSEELFAPVGFEADRIADFGGRWTEHQCRTAQEVLNVAGDAVVIVVQSVRPLLTREVIEKLPACRCMIRAGAGYDSINWRAATEQGIMVCNAPTYCSDEVADHAIALLLSCLRHVTRLDRALREGKHDKKLAGRTRRLDGSTLGVVGLGRIAQRLVQRMRAWDLTILAYDPYIEPARAEALNVQLVDLDTLLRASDFITLHCPLTEETRHLISWDAFEKMKPSAILVNDSRGGVIDQEALIDALRRERIWAAGLDVTEKEPIPPDSPLLQLDNVVITPHVAAYSPQSRHELYTLICEIAGAVLRGETPPFVVNPEVLEE